MPVPVAAHRRSRERVAWIAAASLGVALVATAAIAMMHLLEAPPVVDPIQFTIGSPDNSLFTGTTPQFAVSPDGRHVVFAASAQSATMLWIRALGTLVAHPMPGTEQATYPFGRPTAASSDSSPKGKLKKVHGQWRSAGPVMRCAEWARRHMNSDNVILFSPSSASPLHRVTSAGGTHPHHRDRDECPFPSLAGIPA